MPRPVRRGRRSWIFVGSVVAALALLAGLIMVLAQGDDNGDTPTSDAGSIGVVDADSGELVASVAVGRSIAGISSNDDHVFATDPSGRVLVQIDPSPARRHALVRPRR